MRFFGVSQMCHGHEYRWIYDSKTLVEELKLSSEDEILGMSGNDLFFPIGGSNCSCTFITELKSGEEVKEFLTAEGDGPDSEDPMLVDIAEYLLTVSSDEGSCTSKFLDDLGLKEYTTSDDKHSLKEEAEKLVEALKEAGYEDFDYEDPFYGENRFMTIQELRDLRETVLSGRKIYA